MSEDELKQAELRGYGKGYAAGRQRKKRDISQESLQKKKDAFWQRAFLAALPVAFTINGWKRGSVPIVNLPDRMKLAADVADEALSQAIGHLL